MNNLRKKGTKYTELERKSYLREYLASTETKRHCSVLNKLTLRKTYNV